MAGRNLLDNPPLDNLFGYFPPHPNVSGVVRPDFLFADPAGEPIVWEHLGLLIRDDYRRSWERKREWYLQNGFVEGDNLFTTQDDEKGGLDSEEVRRIAELANITLTIIQFPDHLTPLTALQVQILELLDLSPDLYRSLAENST